MVFTFLVVFAAVILIFLLHGKSGSQDGPEGGESAEDDWKFGDVWKRAGSEEKNENSPVPYVELLRMDTGSGYDDTSMMDLVGYLGSRGIRATFDSFSLGLEPAAIKTYVLKVEAGKEEEALSYLREKFSSPETRFPER